MLLLKKRYFDAVLRGDKVTTLRFWRRPCVRPGSIHLVPGLGRARILNVSPVRLQDIGEEDARADGFASLRALRAAMKSLYPRRDRAGRTLYLVRFVFLGKSSQPRPRKRKPADSLPGKNDNKGNILVK
jgi:hypothetical protein